MFSEIIHGLIWRTQIDSGVDPNCPDETLLPSSLRIGIIPAGQKHSHDSWNQMYCFYFRFLVDGIKMEAVLPPSVSVPKRVEVEEVPEEAQWALEEV